MPAFHPADLRVPILGALLLVAMLVLATGCRPSGADTSRKIVITGSSTAAPLVTEIGRRYESTHPGVRVEVQTGGSSRGIADVRQGLSSLGMSSRSLTAAESGGCRVEVLARDGVAFIVHADNPMRFPTRADLRAILTGGITRWSELDGRDAPIHLVSRADGRSELELVREFFDLERGAIAATIIAGETQQALKSVITDENAITFLSLGSAEFEVERGGPIRLLPLDGVPATSESVANGRYPLQRPLLFVARVDATAEADAFLRYALSSDHDDLIARNAFVPIP